MNEDYDFNNKPFTVFTWENRKPDHKGRWNYYGIYDNTTNSILYQVPGRDDYQFDTIDEACDIAIKLNASKQLM